MLSKLIERQVDYINEITGNSKTAWHKIDGKIVANIGNYHVTPTFDDFRLHQIVNKNGGVHTIFVCTTKKSLFDRIQTMLENIQK